MTISLGRTKSKRGERNKVQAAVHLREGFLYGPLLAQSEDERPRRNTVVTESVIDEY